MGRKYMNVTGMLSPIRLVILSLLMSVSLILSSCNGADKGLAPASSPAAEQSQLAVPKLWAKPIVAGVKLIPKTISASKSKSGREPKGVMEGDDIPGWIAGDVAPQWIQLDLGQPTAVSEVILEVDQTPNGPSTHEIWGGPTPENLKLLGTLDGNTQAGQWLELKVVAQDVRYLKVLTTKSPSWVAWSEIEVYK